MQDAPGGGVEVVVSVADAFGPAQGDVAAGDEVQPRGEGGDGEQFGRGALAEVFERGGFREVGGGHGLV